MPFEVIEQVTGVADQLFDTAELLFDIEALLFDIRARRSAQSGSSSTPTSCSLRNRAALRGRRATCRAVEQLFCAIGLLSGIDGLLWSAIEQLFAAMDRLLAHTGLPSIVLAPLFEIDDRLRFAIEPLPDVDGQLFSVTELLSGIDEARLAQSTSSSTATTSSSAPPATSSSASTTDWCARRALCWPGAAPSAQMPRVSATRTARHFFFSILLNRYGPHSFEVRDEVLLSKEPPRIDYLLLRKMAELALGDTGQTLHQLWPLLPRVSVVELKTVGRPYRTGDLDKLWSYVHAYFAHEHQRLDGRDDLCAVLIVPARTPSLDNDARSMALSWGDLGAGYWRLTGGLFTLHVLELDVVGRQDDEDLLALFSRNDMRTPRALQFWGELLGSKMANMDVQQLEGYDELVRKLLSALPPEQRLAGLAPEQRLAGLPPEQLVLALPDDMLRKLPDDFLATLSDGARAAIRKRLDH